MKKKTTTEAGCWFKGKFIPVGGGISLNDGIILPGSAGRDIKGTQGRGQRCGRLRNL